ncbi:Uncharacterized protein FKW44_002891, partial [Caligus rogercresseyi]
MVLSFFDNCGVIFQHYLPMRTSVTTTVFKDVMNMFLKKFKEKRPEMAQKDWFFHFDNAPCHTANSTKGVLSQEGDQDFFYFPVMKKMLEGVGDRRQEHPEGVDPGRRAIPEDRF